MRNTGALEILYGGQDSNVWSYQYDQNTNNFEQTGSFGFVRYGLAVGDVTGNGIQNLVTGLNQNNILNVYEFDGSSYQLIDDIPLATFGATNPRNLAIGDFNQNGRDEIAVLGYTNGNWFGILEYNTSTLDYQMKYFLDLPGTAVGLGFYDTSGNGMPNIWFGGSSGQVYNVEFNDITEEYELVWQTNIGGAWVGSFDFADFNNNGRTNIVTSRNTGRQVVVFEYDNQGGYDEIYTSNVLPNAQRDGLVPMFIDFNGDGELGVAIGGRNGYIEFFDIGNPDPVFSRQFNPPGTNRVAAHFGSSMLVMGRGDPRGIQYPYISDITIGFAEERSQSPEKSFVRNIGSTLTFSYTNFEIEFYNETTTSWQNVVTIFDGASSSEMNPGLGIGGLFSLRDEFINRGSFNSTDFEPGLYRVNFAFTDPFGNVLENSDSNLVQTSYEFNLTLDESGPDILGSSVSPEVTGVGDFVTIQVDAQDFSGIDRVWTNITYPDSSTMMLDLNQITTLRYQLIFNDTWQRGEYEIEIYLNDTNGFLSSVNYTLEIVGDLDISIATLENLYFPDSFVDLTSPFSWWVSDWNYRIPLILEASNAPRPYVLLRQEVDFTQSLAEIYQLGIFDVNSIRVIEYDVFGNPIVYNSSRSGDDRFIIPTKFTPASDFSATTNAAGILEFKVEGPIPANTQKNFLIYFDIEENGIKAPAYKTYTPPKEFLAYVRETGIAAVIEYTGAGATGFAPESIIGEFSPSNDNSRGIVIADFTNNGMYDIVFGGSSGGLFVDLKFFEQTSPMNFVDRGITSQNSIFANRITMDLVAGDFNNNGNMDLVFSGNTNEVYFIPGNGDGTFGQEQLVYNDLGNIRGKTVGDFTGNGNLDVIFTMSGSSGRFILLRGEGDGTFVEVSLFNPPSNDGYCLTGGDFNNDGFLDLFYDPRASSTAHFFAGDGLGEFSSPQSLFSVPDFSGCDAYDFNRDGNLDVYMVIRDGDVLEHRGFGDGTFQTPAQATILGTPDSRTFAISAPNTFGFETSTFNIQTRADSSIPSRILNNINAVTRPYINLSVEFYNETTTSWEFYDVLVDTSQEPVFENSLLDLRTYYEAFGRWNTTNSPSGLYSVVLRLEDNEGNILTNILGEDYIERFNFTISTDIEGPTYNNFIITPENVGYNQSVSFRVDVLDESGVDSVWANITTPSGQSIRVDLEQFFGARYVFDNYSPTWEFGDYNITIFANDTLSQLSNISQIFRVSAISDISMNVGRFSYFSNSTVDITNSFILNSDFTNYSFYLEMGVERFNTTSSTWELFEVVIDNLHLLNKTSISTNENINLVSIWDAVGRWNTTDSLGGFYRIYTRLVDNESNTLLQNDSIPLFQTTPAFNVLNISGATIINNYQIEPQTLGLGRTSTIQINVSSTAGIDSVWANITLPDLQVLTFSPVNIGDDIFMLEIDESWLSGVHSIDIFANDSAGNSIVNTTSYIVQSNVSGSIATIEENYEHNEIVKLNSPFEWFNESWNYRVPVVFDEFELDRHNLIQQIEINFTQLIEQLGFVGNLDVNSLRLVEYFENGSMRVYNSSISNNNQFVAGMRKLPTSGFNTLNNAAYRFDIRLDGITPANTQRTFMMYFDIEENGIKDEFEVSLNQPQLIAVLTELSGRYRTAKINEDGTFGSFDFWGFQLSSNNAGAGVADYTNSGAYDIVHGGNSRIFFAEQTGDNSFTSRGPLVAAGWMPNDWIMGMASGDFNHNGFKDFVVGGNNNIYYVGFGNGDGIFTTQLLDTTDLGGNSRGKDAGDITNNGILDVVASHTNGRVYAFINDGEGNFTTSEVLNAGSNNAYCLTLGDFTGDGNVDIIMDTGNFADNEYTLYTGNGDGSFNPSGTVLFSVNLLSGCDSYDINNNGYLDLLFIDDRTDVYVAYGNGDGTFQTPELVFAHPDNHQSRDISLPNMPLQYSYSLFDIEEVASIQIPSLFFNEGVTDTEFQLVITIDYFNEGTSAWELFDTIVNETSYSTLFTGQSIDLSREFSQAGNWNTSTFDFGLYRVNAYLLGERGILESSNPSTLMQEFHLEILDFKKKLFR